MAQVESNDGGSAGVCQDFAPIAVEMGSWTGMVQAGFDGFPVPGDMVPLGKAFS